MNELALFAGAGGGLYAAQERGHRIVCAVERDAYAAQVLAQRQNDGIFPPFPIWSDVSTFDARPWRGIVDIISGGFPCQDISAAGKGAGIDGERSGLWSEFSRIIRDIRPLRVEVENSPMLTSRGLDRVLGDLAALGYDAQWGCLSVVKRMYPTPTAHNAKEGGFPAEFNRNTPTLAAQASLGGPIGPLNPPWTEWLMGWPSGATDLRPLEMVRFLEWRKAHSINWSTFTNEHQG